HKDRRSDALLKLLAGMLGIGLDTLKRRDAQRRRRRVLWLTTGSFIGMCVAFMLASAAWVARNEAVAERKRAETEAETARQTTRFLVDLFRISDPTEAQGNSITAREILDRGASRVDLELADQPAIQATLMDTMGTVYTSLGLYRSAIPLMASRCPQCKIFIELQLLHLPLLMRFALLIITYTSPQQTQRLINKLNNGNFDFYIHVDKKHDINTHKDLFNIPNVYFIKNRVDIKWAGYTTQRAAFNGVKEIRASGKEYAFINLLSGQDYPIRSAEYIEAFLKANVGKQLIKCNHFETEWKEAISRIDRYHLPDVTVKGKYFVERVLNTFVKRPAPPVKLDFYGSNATFWTLSPECIYYIVDYVESNKKLLRFFQLSWGSDEFVVQTIIMNSTWRNEVVNENYRYVDWSGGGSRPKFLTVNDFDRIMASGAIFARKFNIEKDEQILDMIDNANLNS
ncbi:MAG: hypothetical protein EOP51_19305, partial [Sphingobacteriales bacterium]